MLAPVGDGYCPCLVLVAFLSADVKGVAACKQWVECSVAHYTGIQRLKNVSLSRPRCSPGQTAVSVSSLTLLNTPVNLTFNLSNTSRLSREKTDCVKECAADDSLNRIDVYTGTH